MNIETIARQLSQVGYIVLEQPLLRSQSAQLYSRCQENERQRFHPARVGRGAERQQLNAIRDDVICWLDDGDGIDHAYLAWMEKLRSGLNEALYLGLFDYECHYAIYCAGAGYARHLTRSRTRCSRLAGSRAASRAGSGFGKSPDHAMSHVIR